VGEEAIDHRVDGDRGEFRLGAQDCQAGGDLLLPGFGDRAVVKDGARGVEALVQAASD
jgi:hypothetical protein